MPDLIIPEGATPSEQLRSLLAFWDDMRRKGEPAQTKEWVHRSSEGLVLSLGTEYTPRPLPAGEQPMTIKQCFANSYYQAAFLRDDLTYVEGYAMSELGMPTHHAWLVDKDGAVYDYTWRWTDDERASHFKCSAGALMGLPVPTDLLLAIWSKREYVGVLQDYEHDFPVLRLGWDPDALRDYYHTLPDPSSRNRRKRATRKRASTVVA